jgi:hypothetical protein
LFLPELLPAFTVGLNTKKPSGCLGPVIFFLLGIFSLVSILNGSFSARDFLTPAEMIDEAMEEETMEIFLLLPSFYLPILLFCFRGYWLFPHFF